MIISNTAFVIVILCLTHVIVVSALMNSPVFTDHISKVKSSALYISKTDDSSVAVPSSLVTLAQRTDNELKTLMDSMPMNEKYTLLLQSYSSTILGQRRLQSDKSIDLLQNMESLYTEMIQQAIVPEPAAAQALIDASSKFANVAVMSKAARLIRAGKLETITTYITAMEMSWTNCLVLSFIY